MRRQPRCMSEVGSDRSGFILVEMSSRMEDVSVSMKRRAEKAGLQEDESPETVMNRLVVGFSYCELQCCRVVLRGQVQWCSCRQSVLCDRLVT